MRSRLAILAGLVQFALGIHALAGDDMSHTIEVGGVLIAYAVGADRSVPDEAKPLSVRLQDPPVRGVVTLPLQRLEMTADGSPASCCNRVLIIADNGERVFTGLSGPTDSVFALIVMEHEEMAVPLDRPRRYIYETPSLHLPEDGQIVKLRLNVDGVDVAVGVVRLDHKTLVVPVHVHVFAHPTYEIHQNLTESWVRTWFDPDYIETRAESIGDAAPGTIETTVIARDRVERSPFLNPDGIWMKAGIQFELASYNLVRQPDGLERTLVNAQEANPFCSMSLDSTRVGRYHESHAVAEPGVHIYVGGSIGQPLSNGNYPGATCGSFRLCEDSARARDMILLNAQLAHTAPFSLAHELGHYLGLHHSDQAVSCGRSLLGEYDAPSENLMEPSAAGLALSAAQISRARAQACDALSRWGRLASGCP